MAGWKWKDNDIKKFFKASLLNVGIEYYFVESPAGTKEYMERIFAYELYHQMKILFPANDGNIGGPVLHGEYRKAINLLSKEPVKLNRNIDYIPDLLVHTSYNTRDNLLAVEIKTAENISVDSHVLADLRKLQRYSVDLDFRNAIFLQINSNFEEIYDTASHAAKQEIRDILQNKNIEIWNIPNPAPDRGARIYNNEYYHRFLDKFGSLNLSVDEKSQLQNMKEAYSMYQHHNFGTRIRSRSLKIINYKNLPIS